MNLETKLPVRPVANTVGVSVWGAGDQDDAIRRHVIKRLKRTGIAASPQSSDGTGFSATGVLVWAFTFIVDKGAEAGLTGAWKARKRRRAREEHIDVLPEAHIRLDDVRADADGMLLIHLLDKIEDKLSTKFPGYRYTFQVHTTTQTITEIHLDVSGFGLGPEAFTKVKKVVDDLQGSDLLRMRVVPLPLLWRVGVEVTAYPYQPPLPDVPIIR